MHTFRLLFSAFALTSLAFCQGLTGSISGGTSQQSGRQ